MAQDALTHEPLLKFEDPALQDKAAYQGLAVFVHPV
jgi:hypothetical protein